MIYLYIRPEVKKNDTAAVTTAINEACIGGLQQNFWLVGGGEDFSGAGNEKKNFLLLGGILPYRQSFPKKIGGRGRAIHIW